MGEVGMHTIVSHEDQVDTSPQRVEWSAGSKLVSAPLTSVDERLLY
jgi:hypothetical protein